MKNITLFGATGATGILLIQKALNDGYNVTVYARNPAKIQIKNSNLKIVTGELTDAIKIEEAVIGALAVISVLGPVGKSKDLSVADGTKLIVAAMKKNNVKRLIATATPSVKDRNDKYQFSFSFAVFMIKTLAKNSYDNIVLAGKHTSESGLDWTMVRLPMLSDKPTSGKLNVGYTGDGQVNLFSLSRADLASFLLSQVNDTRWINKAPVVTN